jgi:hypothetical protein
MADRGTYQIRVQGQISERWAHLFDEMSIETDQGGDAAPTSMLSGPVADQAALMGLLQTLYALGLPLLSVQRVELGAAQSEMLLPPTLRADRQDR